MRFPQQGYSTLLNMGVSIVMGVSQDGWFISWKIPLEWMITSGTPVSGNHHLPTTSYNPWTWVNVHAEINFTKLTPHFYQKGKCSLDALSCHIISGPKVCCCRFRMMDGVLMDTFNHFHICQYLIVFASCTAPTLNLHPASTSTCKCSLVLQYSDT